MVLWIRVEAPTRCHNPDTPQHPRRRTLLMDQRENPADRHLAHFELFSHHAACSGDELRAAAGSSAACPCSRRRFERSTDPLRDRGLPLAVEEVPGDLERLVACN